MPKWNFRVQKMLFTGYVALYKRTYGANKITDYRRSFVFDNSDITITASLPMNNSSFNNFDLTK